MRILRELSAVFRSNGRLILIYAVAVPVALMLMSWFHIFEYQSAGREFTRADLIVQSVYPPMTSLLYGLFACYFVLNLLRFDFFDSVIMRQRGRRILFLIQAAKGAVVCFCLALYVTLYMAGLAYLLCSEECNWDQTNSCFYFCCYGTMEPPPMIAIFTACFLYLFFSCMVMVMVLLVCKWAFYSEIPGWMVVVGLCAMPTAGVEYGYYHYANIHYDRWYFPHGLQSAFVVTLIWLAVLFAAGVYLAKRKDFIDARQR